MVNDPDALTVEERAIVLEFHIGGFGPPGSLRHYPAVASRLVERLRVPLSKIPDPKGGRGRPSAASRHRRRHVRCKLYRHIALATLEAFELPEVEGRNNFRRKTRALATGAKTLEEVGASAVTLRRTAEQLVADRKTAVANRRAVTKEAIDALCLNVAVLLRRHTTLSGGQETVAIGQVLAAANLGSSEPAAVRQRLRRISPERKRLAPRKPGSERP